MSKRIVGLTAAGVAGVAAAAALAFAGTRSRRARGRSSEAEPRGEAHMWGIIAGAEPAEQVLE